MVSCNVMEMVKWHIVFVPTMSHLWHKFISVKYFLKGQFVAVCDVLSFIGRDLCCI